MGMFNLREPQKSAIDVTLKTVKKYKIFWDFQCIYCSASWRSSGLAEIQTGTWGGVSPDDDNGEVSLCKLVQLSTPPLTALYFAVLKLRTLGSKGWVITEQTDVCWRPTWITQTDLRPPDKKKKLQQKPVYRPRLTSQLVLRQNLKCCHHKIIQACCSWQGLLLDFTRNICWILKGMSWSHFAWEGQEEEKVDLQPSESNFELSWCWESSRKKPLHTVFGKVHKKHLVCFVINIWVFLAGFRLTKTLVDPISNHILLTIPLWQAVRVESLVWAENQTFVLKGNPPSGFGT